MALWPAATVADLDGLLRFYAVPAEVWQAFATAAGDPPDLRPLACLPAPAVVEATTSATTSTGRRLTMVEAIQVGLVYRAAHRFLHLAAGGEMDSWRDPDPWGANPAGVAATSSRATGAPTANLGEKKVKFSNVLEQGDDTEFVLDEALNKAPFYTQFVQVMGGMPEDLEDPTLEQLAAMVKKVKILRQPPYADFAIWLPYAKKHLKTQKYKSFVMMQDGSFITRMVPGPACFQHWLLSFRVLRTTLVMMDQVGLANLMQWENKIEMLNHRYENCWHLIAEQRERGANGQNLFEGEDGHRRWGIPTERVGCGQTVAGGMAPGAQRPGLLAGTSSPTSDGLDGKRIQRYSHAPRRGDHKGEGEARTQFLEGTRPNPGGTTIV